MGGGAHDKSTKANLAGCILGSQRALKTYWKLQRQTTLDPNFDRSRRLRNPCVPLCLQPARLGLSGEL